MQIAPLRADGDIFRAQTPIVSMDPEADRKLLSIYTPIVSRTIFPAWADRSGGIST